MRKRFGLSLALFVLSVMFFTVNGFSETGNDWLKKVEATINAPKDKVSEGTMILIDKDGTQKTRKMKMWQKGEDKKLDRFLSPADVKGVSLLSLSDDEMYLYMPAFHKIRRIASSAKNESFMGTDFTYDDMNMNKLSDKYNAKILKEDANTVTLELTPKPGKDVSYSKEIMVVNKKNDLAEKVEFYNKGREKEKVLTADETKKVGKYWTITKMTMENILNNHKTQIITEDLKFDVGLPNKLFTKRMLKKRKIGY